MDSRVRSETRRRGRALTLGLAAVVVGCGLDKLVSSPSVEPGDQYQLGFTAQPQNTPQNAVMVPAVRVSVVDDLGNVVTSYTGDVTVAIGANPGGGTLAGSQTRPAVAGVATFPNLSIDQAGNGYTLTARSTSFASATSERFDVVGGIIVIGLRMASVGTSFNPRSD